MLVIFTKNSEKKYYLTVIIFLKKYNCKINFAKMRGGGVKALTVNYSYINFAINWRRFLEALNLT